MSQTKVTTAGQRDDATTARSHSESILPTQRDLHFAPPADRICDWHAAGPNVTQLMNALSLFFPGGERMFIDAVREYRDEIPDPDLRKAARAFIGQEAMHSREHGEYNDLMEAAGLPAHNIDHLVWERIRAIQNNTPRVMPLLLTIALEHYTALMGDMLLRYPDMI